MLAALAFMASVVVPNNVKAADILHQATRIPKDVFYLAELPSGTMFCDHIKAKRQQSRFDSRYGARYNRLIVAVANHDGLGWQPDDVIVTPCYRITRKAADVMLDRLEDDLTLYEKRYRLKADGS